MGEVETPEEFEEEFDEIAAAHGKTQQQLAGTALDREIAESPAEEADELDPPLEGEA